MIFAVFAIWCNYNLIQCEKDLPYLVVPALQFKHFDTYMQRLVSTRGKTPMFCLGDTQNGSLIHDINTYGKLSHIHLPTHINYDKSYEYHALFASHHIINNKCSGFFFLAIASLIVYKHAQFSKANNYQQFDCWLCWACARICLSLVDFI